MSAITSDAAPLCTPNINAVGRRRRRRIGGAMSAAAVAFLGWSVATGAPASTRALVCLPVMAAAVGFLQVRRNTCVVLAVAGRREDGNGMAPVSAGELRDSRRVSWTIARDALAAGALAAGLGAVTALIR